MNEKDLKLTDLDYAVGNHHLQMMKAALPYMEIPQQKTMSMFIKWNELMRTMEFFNENDDGMLSVCSVDEKHTSPVDMLSAVKPYANEQEQELIDIMSKVIQARRNRPDGTGSFSDGPGPLTMDQLLAILPQEQRSRIETLRMIMQTMGSMSAG